MKSTVGIQLQKLDTPRPYDPPRIDRWSGYTSTARDALEAGAEDIEVNEDGSMTVTTDPDDYQNVLKEISSSFDLEDSEIALIPENSISLDLETSLKVYKLLEMLEDLDDTQNVHSNADFDPEMVNHLD